MLNLPRHLGHVRTASERLFQAVEEPPPGLLSAGDPGEGPRTALEPGIRVPYIAGNTCASRRGRHVGAAHVWDQLASRPESC